MLQIENGVVFARAPQGRLSIGLTGFFLLAFALSWVGAAPMVLTSWAGPETPNGLKDLLGLTAPLQLLMIFGTLIAALFVTSVNYGFSGLKSLFGAVFKFKVSPVWYLLALAGPALLSVVGLVASRHVDPALSPVSFQVTMLTATAQIFFVYLLANTEEIAWRGYALPQLQRSFSPMTANFYLCVIWGVFHMPLFAVKGGHPAGYSLALFALMVVAVGMIAGYIFNATRGSVLIAHLLHQSLNAWSEGLRLFPVMNDGSPWPFRITVFAIAAVGVVAAMGLALKRKPKA